MESNNENKKLNNEPNNFRLPDNYFQQSASSILNKIDWIEEHKLFPKLNGLKKETGLSVPNNYFNINEIKLELFTYPNLCKHSKNSLFKIPANYFEQLETKQFINLIGEHVLELSAFKKLNSIAKQNNFKVNETYFRTNEDVLNTILFEDDSSNRVIPLFSRKLYYGVAAILTVTLGLWLYDAYFNVKEVKNCGTLACIDKKDLIKSKILEHLDNDQLYELVDTKKLEYKLNNKSKKNTTKNTRDSSLKNLSTQDFFDEI